MFFKHYVVNVYYDSSIIMSHYIDESERKQFINELNSFVVDVVD